MILLKELKISNFLSHEKTEISFGANEKLLLDGKSGSGKSSITEAILWVLYGKGRSENRSLVRRGGKTATVSLKLGDGELTYNITRSVSTAGKTGLTVTRSINGGSFSIIETTGIKDTQAWIEKTLLKASYELFTNSIAYPQENENSFVKASASRRKDLLLEIIGAENFDTLYDKTRTAINTNQLENSVLLTKVENLEKTIKASEEVAEKYEFFKGEVEAISSKVENLILVEKDLEKKSSEISGISRQISDKKALGEVLLDHILIIDKRLEEDREKVAEHAGLDIDRARKSVSELELEMSEIKKIEQELRENSETQQKINNHLANKPSTFDYSKDIESLNKRLIPLIKDTNKCPAGDKCPFVVPIKGQIDFLEEQIKEKTEKSIQEKELLENWEKTYVSLVPIKDTTELYKKLEDLRSLSTKLFTFKQVVVGYELFEKTLEEIKNREISFLEERTQISSRLLLLDREIKELEATFKGFDTNQINVDLANTRVLLQNLQQSKEKASINVAMAIRAQEAIKEASTELVELKKGIETAQEDSESLELLKEALSPRGIKAVVVDYLVPQLEERINDILGEMSDFRIRLDTQKATADEEGVKEGLFITVVNDYGEELPFSSYSGGEKVKITVAISEALASLMVGVGFRIMDENIVSLDRESTEGFVVVLTKLQEKFPQLLVISHLQEVKDIFEKKIDIIKVSGVSKII